MTGVEPPAIAVQGLRNLRDVGGLSTDDGGVTRSGILYRADAPTGLSDGAVIELAQLGLRAVVDLRDETEGSNAPHTLPHAVRRFPVGIEPPRVADGRDLVRQILDGDVADFGPTELAGIYSSFLEDQAEAFGRAIELIADPANHPILVHCHAGKDRTGLVIALVLLIAGVRREAVIADYALTGAWLPYDQARFEADLQSAGTSWERVAALFSAPGSALEMTLEELERGYGSIAEYLVTRARLDVVTLKRLGDVLTETSGREI